MEGGTNYTLIYIFFAINSILGIANRVCQITYYCMTDFIKEADTAKNTALTFCILPSAVNLFMILIYIIFHSEPMHTCAFKLKNFFLFLVSMEFLLAFGVHLSFKTKYSFNADNIVVTMKVVNASHVMFVAIPQILIVCIYSSAVEEISAIGIASLVCSTLFLIWSGAYYFICAAKDDDFDDFAQDKCGD